MPADIITTARPAATLIAVAALAIAVLPWSRSEVEASWGAWAALVGLVRRAWARLREAPAAPAPGLRTPS